MILVAWYNALAMPQVSIGVSGLGTTAVFASIHTSMLHIVIHLACIAVRSVSSGWRGHIWCHSGSAHLSGAVHSLIRRSSGGSRGRELADSNGCSGRHILIHLCLNLGMAGG